MSKMKGLKKTLAVFMAALMVMSCWVFTPIATEAEAAEAGQYYYRIIIDCTDPGEDDGGSTWTNYAWRLYGQYDYGTGAENAKPEKDTGNPLYKEYEMRTEEKFTLMEGYGEPGWFPTKLVPDLATKNTGFLNLSTHAFRFKVQVWVGSSDTNLTCVYDIDATPDGSVSTFNTELIFSGKPDTYSLPAAKEVKFANASSATLTIPKVGENAQTVDCTAAVYDQYGVQMTNHTPLYYLTSEAPTSYPTKSETVSGVSLSGSTLNVTSDALMTNGDAKNVYVTAVDTTANTTQYVTKQITLNDPDINFTLYNTKIGSTSPGSSDSGSVISRKYGNTLGVEPSGIREGFEFAGFYTQNFADSYDIANYYNGTKLTKDTEFKADTNYYAAWQANKYTLTFVYRNADGSIKTDEVTGYYDKGGFDVPVPTDVKTTDENYKFKGWDKTVPNQMPAKNETYTAQYEITYNYAKLDALNEQTKTAKDIVDNSEYYPNGYTAETLNAFDQAYETAKKFDSTTKASQQTAVDDATKVLENAIKNLTVKKFVVIFADENGDIITNGYHYVNWGESINVPDTPTKAYDAEYHYTFASWDKDPTDLCAKVTADAIFKATFTKTAHGFTETPTPSTCTEDGVITKTCSTCGYSYTVTNTADLKGHTWIDYEEPATCATAGVKAKVCSVCGVYQEGTIEVLEATGEHRYGDWIPDTSATCENHGTKHRECSVCHTYEYETISANGHDWGTKTVVNPTCTTAGYTKETCSVCGLVRMTEPKNKTGHKITITTEPSTCTAKGYTMEKCTNKNCDYCKITWNDTLTEHNWSDYEPKVDATCGHQGLEVRKCSTCATVDYKLTDKLTKHNYVTQSTVQATCTQDGEIIEVCSGCGDVQKTTIKASGSHVLEKDDDKSQEATCTSPSITVKKCKNCDYTEVTVGTDTKDHDFKEVAGQSQSATCGQSGYKTMRCSGCGYEYKMYDGNATGKHTWGTPTTTQVGTQLTVSGKCDVCGDEYTATVTVAEGHTYNEVKTLTPATCKKTGKIVIACNGDHDSTCTATVEATLPINNDAHVGGTTTAETSATCTSAGTAVTTCNDCKKTIATFEIPAMGHSYTNKTSETPATCVSQGSVTLKCANCNDTKVIDTDVNPDAHKYEKQSDVNATCTTPAYEVWVCKNPGCTKVYTKYAVGSKALGHDWNTTVTQNGNLITVTRKCSTCEEVETVVENSEISLGHKHDFTGAVETVTEADCKTEGVIKVACKTCEETLEVKIGKKDVHNNLETEYTEPTCENNGLVKTYCKDCKAVLAETTITKLGHDFFTNLNDATVKTPATCTKSGTKTVKCSRCDKTTDVTVPKTGHDYKKVDGGKTATCTEYGYDVYKCDCGATYNALIEELGHNITSPTTKEPTCTEEGYTEGYCENCKTTVKTDIKPANGHKYSDGVVTPATCTSQGYTTHNCKNCDYSYKDSYTPLADHDYEGEGCVTVTDPTCTTKGYTTYKCANCMYSYIDNYTDALGHDFDKDNGEAGTDADGKKYTKYPCKNGCGEWQYEYLSDGCSHENAEFVKTVAPTCTADGYDVYNCTTCGNSEIHKNIKPALGHDWDFWEIIKHPTETENGIQQSVCKRCELVLTEEIVYGKYYLVTFYNYDGTRLIRPAYYAHGRKARMPEVQPIKTDDSAYTYTFKGYSFSQAEIDCVTKSMAIIAEYDAHERSYDVTYLNGDGSTLQVLQNVKYTQMGKVYTGPTPTKPNDEYYTYTFETWSISCDEKAGMAVATPVFTQKLTSKDNDPDAQDGILTGFINWIKKIFMQIFGRLFK